MPRGGSARRASRETLPRRGVRFGALFTGKFFLADPVALGRSDSLPGRSVSRRTVGLLSAVPTRTRFTQRGLVRLGTSGARCGTRPTALAWADFAALIEAFRGRGFRAGNAWYLNDTANMANATLCARRA